MHICKVLLIDYDWYLPGLARYVFTYRHTYICICMYITKYTDARILICVFRVWLHGVQKEKLSLQFSVDKSPGIWNLIKMVSLHHVLEEIGI